MLSNFFKLNEPFKEIADQTAFEAIVQADKVVAHLLVKPEKLTGTTGFRTITERRFENVSFSKKKIEELTFEDCAFEDCLFIDTHFERCVFRHCYFRNCNFWKATFNRTFVDPQAMVEVADPHTFANIGVGLFQELARDSADANQHEHRASAEFLFNKWKRYQLAYEHRTRKIVGARYAASLAGYFASEWVLGYGWRPGRLAITIVSAVIFLFLLNYAMWPLYGLPGSWSDRSVFSALYFTAGTVTTFGQGGFTPTSKVGLVVTAIEGFIGVILFALMASIAFKKAVRS